MACDLTGSRGLRKVRYPSFAIGTRPTSPQSKMNTTHRTQDIDQLQLEAYRQMTGEERLRIGLGLYEASRGVAREAIRNRFPDADDATVEEKLRQRIRVGYEIEAASRKNPSPPAPLPKQVRGEGSQRSDGSLPINGARGASGLGKS